MAEDDDVIRGTKIDGNTVYDTTSQDIEPYLDRAKFLRDSAPEHGKYSKTAFGCVYACTIPSVLVEQMMRGQCCPDGVKYNVLADDPDEARRAYVHVQNSHSALLTVKGKPFAKKRSKWH